MQEKKPRLHVLDLIRGLAVFLMLSAHAVYFFHNRDNNFLISLEKAGNAFCFTAFVLISGATSYIAYLRYDLQKEDKRRIYRKILLTLFFYYLIAFFVESKEIINSFGIDRLKLFFDIVTFRLLPSYTEYIVPFILYPAILLILGKYFKKISGHITALLALSVGLFLAGYLLYLLPVPGYLIPWKAFLAGNDGFYRFPILQYFPVYLFGLYFGKRLFDADGQREKKRFLFNFGLLLGAATVVLFLLARNSSISLDVLFRRWPPAPAFLLGSMFLSVLAVYISNSLQNLRKIPLLRDFFLILGQNAFSFLWVHILILSIYQMAGASQVSGFLPFFLIFFIFLALSFILAAVLPLNLKFTLSFIKHSHEEELLKESAVFKFGEELALDAKKEEKSFLRFFFPSDNGTLRRKRLIKKRHLLGGLVLGCLVAILIFPSALDEAKNTLSRKNPVSWWNDSFAYRQRIIIKNKSTLSNISKDNTIEIVFDHQKLVQEKKAQIDGSDISIVYFNGAGYDKVDYKLQTEWNKNNTALALKTKDGIKGGKSSSAYFIYYGNFLTTEVQSKGELTLSPPPAEYSVLLRNRETLPIEVSVNKRWILTERGNSKEKLEISAKSHIDLTEPRATYNIVGTNIEGTMDFSSGEFESKIDMTNLKPDSYQIQVTVTDGEQVYKSQKEAFFVTYPLYIAWTFDWEGYDVNGSYLKGMADIAKDYNIPMTHFFNPRIYTTSTISGERKQYLTDWINKRLAGGDGFGLHLHAFYDLVESAGVVQKTEPRWDDNGDGYSVLLSAYTQDEIEKIIAKALSLFDENGLPKPEIFRAGGWYANLELLKALEAMNFKADSSGRTAYEFGKNKVKGFWNLKSTTLPYLPSRSDQNVTSLSDPINILEIPDNGADSYWFSADQMIGRFYDNFKKEALTEKNQVTYLSHPHWFNDKEQAKVRALFDVISAYRYDTDRGPVIFVNSTDIYNAWMNK